MAEAAHGESAHGGMDIADQRSTFHGFIQASIWGSGLVAMGVAMLTLAFAIGAGWWAGLGAFLVIGVAVGLLFKLGGAWWAMLFGAVVLCGIGGMIVPLVAGLA
ncbi:MAG: aa3-type cytochrome c oxidase subunit IV [Hyphomonadaceae bacterium]